MEIYWVMRYQHLHKVINVHKITNKLIKWLQFDMVIYQADLVGVAIMIGHRGSSPSTVADFRQWTESALVQVMACRLCGAKPLPEPMLTYYQLDP